MVNDWNPHRLLYLAVVLLFWAVVNRRSVQDLVLRTAVIYDWAEQPRSVLTADPS